jgi:6-pyruvoyltetrahydropterin/6-carboxytetrahydropterin synthase
MFRVSREFEFSYGHRLLNYTGKCRHLHGHNGRVRVTIETSGLNELGMVLDFGEIKRRIGQWIDDNLDHRLILCRHDPLIPLLEAEGESIYHTEVNPTAENLGKLIFEEAAKLDLPVVHVEFWESERCFAEYSGE